MNHISIILIFFFILSLQVLSEPIAGISIRIERVAKVIDGDTIKLEKGDEVRYIGIDAPEIGLYSIQSQSEYFANESAEFNKQLVEGKNVKLLFDTQIKDSYGRLLAYVYLDNGTFINAELIKQGYAKVSTCPPNIKYTEMFIELEKEARKQNLGIWKNQIEIDNLKKQIIELSKVIESLQHQIDQLFKHIEILEGKNKNIQPESSMTASYNNKIASWKGNGEKTTEPFTIRKSPWVVIWKTKLNNDAFGGGVFRITANDMNGNYVSLIANTMQAGGDKSYVYKAGTFYLEISSLFMDWDVEIYESR